MKLSRIYVIGGPGCGKNYAAKKLSKLLKMPHFDLDKVYWSKKDKSYDAKISEKARDKRFRQIIEKKKWIIDGVYSSWTQQGFEKADLIVLIKCHRHVRSFRILRRSLGRHIKKEPKRDSFFGIIKFLKWNHQWDSNDFVKMKSRLKKYNKKVFSFTKADDAIEFVKEKSKG